MSGSQQSEQVAGDLDGSAPGGSAGSSGAGSKERSREREKAGAGARERERQKPWSEFLELSVAQVHGAVLAQPYITGHTWIKLDILSFRPRLMILSM